MFAAIELSCVRDSELNVSAQQSAIDRSNSANTTIDSTGQTSLPYQVISGSNCIRKASCILFVFVEKKYFGRGDLLAIARAIGLQAEKREDLRIAFFDNKKIPEQILTGKRNAGELSLQTRAEYRFDRNGLYGCKCETLKIRMFNKGRSSLRTVFKEAVG
jgi:hypothetical protein